MRRMIHICLWLLTGIFAEVSLSAQNPFIYHKGKTYKDVAAYRMEEIIDLNTHTPSTPILYEQQVPEHQSTLSYKVALPLYVRGIFVIPAPATINGRITPIGCSPGCSTVSKTSHGAIMQAFLPMPCRPLRATHCSLNLQTENICSPKPLRVATASAGFRLIRTARSRCMSPH